MKIREATETDLSTLVSLNRDLHSRHAESFPEILKSKPSDEDVSGAFRNKMEARTSYWLVAEEAEGGIIGYLSAEFRRRDETWCSIAHRVCYLGGIVVAPEFRGKGVAKALLAVLKREVSARNVFQIELEVWAFNREAKEAFTKLGFHPLMQRMSMNLEQEGPGKKETNAESTGGEAAD